MKLGEKILVRLAAEEVVTVVLCAAEEVVMVELGEKIWSAVGAECTVLAVRQHPLSSCAYS